VDVRHFKATFTFPTGLDPATAQGFLYDPYYADDLIPINDNLYVHLNGALQFTGGSNYPGSVWGSIPYETDGWYIPGAIPLSGFQSGTNVIDIVTEERMFWGGMGYLELRFGPRAPTPTPTATPTVTPNSSLAKDIAGCILDHQDATAHFVIWYTVTGECAIQINAPTTVADYLNNLTDGLEHAYDKYGTGATFYGNDGLHYQFNGLPSPYQVYVLPMRVAVLGGIWPIPAGDLTLPSNIFMSNIYRADLSVVAAHEFFHAVQWTYQPCWNLVPVTINGIPVGYWPLPTGWYNEDVRWWMEATAQWAQHEVFPIDTTYAQYIPDHLGEPWRHMDTRPPEGGTGISYSTLFPFYLIEKQPGGNNKDIIKSTWEQYRANNCSAMMPAINAVLPQGGKISDIFPGYAEANYFLNYSTNIRGALPAGVNPPAPSYRPVADSRDLNSLSQLATGPSQNRGGTIEHLGTAYIELNNQFKPNSIGRSLKITVNITATLTTPPIVRFWRVIQTTPPTAASPYDPPMQLTNQNGTWTGQVTIQNFDSNQLEWVAVEVVNPQTGGSSVTNWSYRAEIIAPTPTPTSTPTRTIDVKKMN